jgi:hypothetical protein
VTFNYSSPYQAETLFARMHCYSWPGLATKTPSCFHHRFRELAPIEPKSRNRKGRNFMPASSLNSPAAINPAPNPLRHSAVSKIQYFFSSEGAYGAWLSTIVICLMIVTLIALLGFPVRRTFANVEVNYNEGWNAYRAFMVANRVPLYGTPPHGFGTGTAYPPISFHLIGLLGTAGTFTLMGRLVSLISLIATGIFVALIVRQGGGSRQIAVFSFLLYEIAIVLLRPDRVGMYDPQLLGEALSTAGLYFYFRNPLSNRLLCVSAIFFCLGGFTKHNLIVFPAAVAIDLLLRSRKAFLTWAGAMLLSAGLLTALTFLIDGHYFFIQLMGGGGGRTYSYHMAWSQYHHYVEKFQCLLVIATAWSIYSFRSRTLFVSAFILSHALAFLLAGGYGVDLNIFFNALAVTVIICGFALSDISFAFAGSQASVSNSRAALMCAIFFISVMIFVPGQLRRDRQSSRELPAQVKEFDSAVQFVKLRPGPALCESLLLCYEAAKPFEYEPFSVRDQINTGRIKESEALQLLRTRHFQTVQIALRSDEENLQESALLMSLGSDQKAPDTDRRFTPNFMQELLEDYQLSMRTSQMAIFCPK